MGSFVRRVTTASGATAVQIMHKRGRRVLGIEHIGSAHTEADLAVLVEVARVRLYAGQEQLPWELESDTGPAGPAGLEPLVEGTASLLLWDALAGVYDQLGFDQLGDDAFKALVLGRIIEPTSKLDTLRCWPRPGCGPRRSRPSRGA